MADHDYPSSKPRLPVFTQTEETRQPAPAVTPRPVPATVTLSGGPLYYREWVPSPTAGLWWLGASVGLILAIVPWRLPWALPGRLLPLSACLALTGVGLALALTAWSFRGLSILVDREGLSWRFGLFGRRYQLREISMFRESSFAYRKRLPTWGIGQGSDGMDAYQVWGGNGEVLDLVVQRGGKSRHYLISTAAAPWLCAAIVRAVEARKGRT